jgi:hypothetical protein
MKLQDGHQVPTADAKRMCAFPGGRAVRNC